MFQQTGCCPRFHVVSSAGSPKFEVSPLCPKKSITRLVAGVSRRYSCIRLVLLFLKKGRAVKSKEMPLGTGNTSESAVKTSTKTTSNQMFQQTGCCPRFHVVSSAGSPKFEVPHCAQKSQSRAWSLELADATVAFVWFFVSWKKVVLSKANKCP